MLSYADIEMAARRIKGQIRHTPLVSSDLLNEWLGFTLWLKAEPLQRSGSFKFRGASHALACLPDDDRPVIAYSSGNHAQAVALAARLAGRSAKIVMPEDAPKLKISNTESYGAEVILYDRYNQSREALGEALQAETGGHLVRPYDDVSVIAGQGTAGLEIAADLKSMGLKPDTYISCCGGGGLLAGTSLALAHHFPGLDIFSAEPAGFDDTARSLAAGERLENTPGAKTICDAIVTPCPGEITFAINKKLAKGGKIVSDTQTLSAMRLALDIFKLVIEPGGAVALAAALSPEFRKQARGELVVAIASGGNLDPEMLARAQAADWPDGIRPSNPAG